MQVDGAGRVKFLATLVFTKFIEPQASVTFELILVKVEADPLLLKVVQSAEDNFPVLVADAMGMFIVVVPADEETDTFVPAVPDVIIWAEFVFPFIDEIPPPPPPPPEPIKAPPLPNNKLQIIDDNMNMYFIYLFLFR